MTARRKCLTAAAVVAAAPLVFSLHRQNSKEPKGLVVASTSVDPATGDLTVGLQNTSSKTIVAYGLVVKQLDKTGKIITDPAGTSWSQTAIPDTSCRGNPARSGPPRLLTKKFRLRSR